jgi:hypothetical protein
MRLEGNGCPLTLAFLNAYDNAPVIMAIVTPVGASKRHGLDLVGHANQFR